MATIEIPNGERLVQIGPNEKVTLTFLREAYFQASDPQRFDPPLAVGLIPAGSTTVYRPVPGSENKDVLYCYTLDGSPISACTNPIGHPDSVTGHIIHVGSGGSVVTTMDTTAFESALESVAKEPGFVEHWPSTKTLLHLLLKAKPPIPSHFRVVIQILAMAGDRIFLKSKERE